MVLALLDLGGSVMQLKVPVVLVQALLLELRISAD